jgi:hypothetical protein
MAEEDIFIQEVSDELKAERLREWWQRFGSWVAAACVALILATIGYQYHTNSLQQANESVTSLLSSTREMIDRKQYEAAAKSLLALPDNAGDITLLARIKAADALTKAGKAAEAKAQWEAIAANKTQPALANYAQLRLGQTNLAPEAPYSALAIEMQAVNLFHQGNKTEAQKLLTSLIESPETPPATRDRVSELLAAFR